MIGVLLGFPLHTMEVAMAVRFFMIVHQRERSRMIRVAVGALLVSNAVALAAPTWIMYEVSSSLDLERT